MKLRPYQEEARDAILGEWSDGKKKTLLVLPTGTGKTVVFSSVVERRDGRSLILAHRGELLTQAADKLQSFGIDSTLEKADSTCLGSSAPVVVGSVQTLARGNRLEKFPDDYFSTIVVDEAHHCLSESYKKVLGHFPGADVLGVTATPDRGDKQELSEYFDSIAYEYGMKKAIDEGYLCKIVAQMIPLKLDISNVSISQGDYALDGIGSALEPYLDEIARQMTIYCRDRKTVVFLPLVKISQEFCQILNEYGFMAAEVNGNSTDREEILSDFDSGKYNVLCNSMLLTEGWDCPSVDCVVVLRPTKVRALYQQMVGRGMRLHPGKDNLLLLDFLWMTERHDLCRPSSLVSKSEDISKRINDKLEYLAACDLMEASEEAERDIVKEREESLAKQLAEMRRKKAKLVDPIQYFFSIASEDLVSYVPTFAWEMEPPTEKQLTMLENRGIDPATVRNKGMASLMIDRLIRRGKEGMSTPKQIRKLEEYGFREVGSWSFEQASKTISLLAKCKWRLPNWIEPNTYTPR